LVDFPGRRIFAGEFVEKLRGYMGIAGRSPMTLAILSAEDNPGADGGAFSRATLSPEVLEEAFPASLGAERALPLRFP
jgi:hypothetical protein